MRRIILIAILIPLGLLAIAGGVGWWVYNSYTYYKTDDANVSGQMLNINSPQAGQLSNYSIKVGDTLTAGQTIATITVAGATGDKANVAVTTPISGTVVQAPAVQGQSVTPNTALLEVANLNSLTITAYIDESTISNVKLNQDVDIHIDAYSGTTYTGHVQRIVQATASQFALLSSTDNASGNFTKVGQRIPVIITLDGTGGNDIVPGMSAEVTIHLH